MGRPVTVTPVAPSFGKATVGNLTPIAFRAFTLLMVALDVDKATGFRGILHVNDCMTLLRVTHWSK
jgi:hypothetical protein